MRPERGAPDWSIIYARARGGLGGFNEAGARRSGLALGEVGSGVTAILLQ